MDAKTQTKYLSVNGGDYLEKRLISYIFGFESDATVVLEKGDDYIVQKTGAADNQYLEMYGRLKRGIFLF